MSKLAAKDVIFTLGMQRHPEGGWYAQTFEDAEQADGRARSTAIYYLLEAGDASHWHRVDAVEVWHYYAGAPLQLRISDGTSVDEHVLGADLDAGQRPQVVVPQRGLAGGGQHRRVDAGGLHGGAGLPVFRLRAGGKGLGAGQA